jgi:mannose-6-phosphate isomerase-like protein (cupin superfamily)
MQRAMRSVLVVLFALLTAGSSVVGAQQAPTKPLPATDVTTEDVHAALNRNPQAAVNPQPNIHVVDAGGYNVAVGAIHRPQTPPGVAAVHFKVTEVYQVLEGAGTLVTGGTLVNAKTRASDSAEVMREDGPGASGTAIQGGVTRRIKAGDVVIIPAGTPHWFSKIEGSISYLVVRVDPGRILTLR